MQQVLAPGRVDDALAKRLVTQFDKDGDGVLSFDEFDQAVLSRSVQQMEAESRGLDLRDSQWQDASEQRQEFANEVVERLWWCTPYLFPLLVHWNLPIWSLGLG